MHFDDGNGIGLPSGKRRSMLHLLATMVVTASIMVVWCALACAGSASATEAYGETLRLGGYVEEFGPGAIPAQDNGKFVIPSGFAVEAENKDVEVDGKPEKNAIYVLDCTYGCSGHTENLENGKLDYRLQKISSETKQVLGSTKIEESFTNTSNYNEIHPLVGLAVDPERKRIYTIVESMFQNGGGEYLPAAAKVVAWSTQPSATGELEPANSSEFPVRDSITGASVVAGEAALKFSGTAAGEKLYAPEGIAVSAETGDVVVEAQQGDATEKLHPGPTMLQAIHTTEENGWKRGEAGQSWVDSEAVTDQEGLAEGLFAMSHDEFGVSVFTGPMTTPKLLVVNMGGASATNEALVPYEQKQEDEAPAVDGKRTPYSAEADGGEEAVYEMQAPGTPVVQLSDGHYAGLFTVAETGGPGGDYQGNVEPWEKYGPHEPEVFWIFGSKSTEHIANVGLRLFEPSGHVLGTIGGGTPNEGVATPSALPGSCNIDIAQAAVAAGADGSVFVLTEPRGEGYGNSKREDDDEVIEFAPGGTYPGAADSNDGKCPSFPEGKTVAVEEAGSWHELQTPAGQSEPSLTVTEGVETKLDAISLDQPRTDLRWEYEDYPFEWETVFEWTPFAFEWNFEGTGYTEVNKMEAPAYLWPSPEAHFKWQTPGTYHADVRVYGDLGTKEYPFLVHVDGTTAASAEFECKPPLKAGQEVTCVSTSVPTGGTEFENYEWKFGDGTKTVSESGPTVEHKFPLSKEDVEYEVTLTVYDNGGPDKTATKTKKVKVEAAEEITTTTSTSTSTNSPSTSTTSTSATSSTTTTTTTKTTAKPKSESKAEKLNKALKGCHKDKSKKKRASCEKQARNRYAPKKVSKGKKTGKGAKKK